MGSGLGLKGFGFERGRRNLDLGCRLQVLVRLYDSYRLLRNYFFVFLFI